MKVALITDIVGVGHAGAGAAVPVLSRYGIQACVAPTAVLSNHCGYESYSYIEMPEKWLAETFQAWKSNGISFDAVMCGFLGTPEQAEVIEQFVRDSRKMFVLDPAFADNGRYYSVTGPEYLDAWRSLIPYSFVVTPNITEAQLLTGEKTAEAAARSLVSMGASNVVITGLADGDRHSNLIYDGTGVRMVGFPCSIAGRPGSGDTFTAVLAARLMQGESLHEAVGTAARAVICLLERADALRLDVREGLPVEELQGME